MTVQLEDGPTQSMTYGELALALYAAAPPTGGCVTAADVAVYAQRGVARLGGVSDVREQYRTWHALNRQLLLGQLTAGGYRRRMAALWPDTARLDWCLAAALRSQHS